MTSIVIQSPPLFESIDSCAASERIKSVMSSGRKWCGHIFHKHTDVISSVGILAITTCLLAAKIFKGIPEVVPRLCRLIFNFGGIIWLNIQVRDFLKSGGDLSRAMRDREFRALVETSAKVFVEGTNIFLTCAFFTAAAVALGGFPQVSASIYAGLRSLSLASLAITISNDLDLANTVKDYFEDKSLLRELERVGQGPAAKRQIAPLIKCFLDIILTDKAAGQLDHEPKTEKSKLASRIVRQLDMQTVEAFQENLGNLKIKKAFIEDQKLFDALKRSVVNKQVKTKSKLSLRALGYISMGICKAYPDTLIEISIRWGMSMLYTTELLRDKFFKSNLAAVIDTPKQDQKSDF